jgi:mRNA-degrading endonuclease RelE of RelBE toxin-antitoxin system
MRDIKKNKRALCIREGQCELLSVKIELPEYDREDAKLFNEYYRKIGLFAEDWAGKFAGEIKKEYEALGERDRKFRFRRYEYRIASRVEPAEEGCICVECVFRLSQNRNTLFEKKISDLWSTDLLLMLRTKPRGKLTRVLDKA